MKYLKKNKLLSLFFCLTILSFILGIFFYVLIDNNTKTIISHNINLLLNNKTINNTLITNNIFVSICIFLLGISIIGVVIIIPIFLFKIFIFSFEFISLLVNLGFKNIFLIILYLLPNFLQIISYFFICYYGCCYSIYLIKHLFKNINYNMHSMTKKYFIIFLFSFVLIICSSLIELFIISKLKLFLIK